MENSSRISLLRASCTKCRQQSDILMSFSTFFGGVTSPCDHKFCQSCFRKENTKIAFSLNCTFTCPCCYKLFFANIQSIDEAILIGEAAAMRLRLNPILLPATDFMVTFEDLTCMADMYTKLINKLEAALLLNPTSYFTLYLLFSSCSDGYMFLKSHKGGDYISAANGLRLLKYSFRLLDHPTVSEQGYEVTKCMCYFELAGIFKAYLNHPAALEYSKLAYELCLRSPNHAMLSTVKDLYLETRAAFAKLPPLRFAVGDGVEFLHELKTGSQWERGKVVELYYRERDFDVSFTAPFRLQVLDDSADQPPVYAWVKADIDRYVRKVGVRSIEDTRYQARLDSKVEELAQVYCSREFIQGVYHTLAQDQEFVEMLQSVWQVELLEDMLSLYRFLVMSSQPLVRTDYGYHIPTAEEVIAGIRAFFDPAHLSDDAAPSAADEDSGPSQRIRAVILNLFRDASCSINLTDDFDIQLHLLQSIRDYHSLLAHSGPMPTGRHARSDFTVPSELSEAISKASTRYAIRHLQSNADDAKILYYLHAWIGIHIYLETAGPACECPFVYFFVKYCLDHDAGVPKLALAVYDRMTMQLSREFIRCANPTCDLNRLDQSTGQVKFKKCSRCHAVIYCSRVCQLAHYPDHKRLCRKHASS